jgi:hypothetical protein
MTDPATTDPVPLEGLAFDIEDLCAALAWVATRPGVQLSVATDHRYVQEALEICPPGKRSPRWCIWRDYEGHLHLDDWVKSEFDLPYHTLPTALAFIELSLGVA